MRFYNANLFRNDPSAVIQNGLARDEAMLEQYQRRDRIGGSFGSKYEYDAFRNQWRMCGERIELAKDELKRRQQPGYMPPVNWATFGARA